MKQFFLYVPLLFATLHLSCVALDHDTICGSECTEDDNATLIRDIHEGLCYYTYQRDIVAEQCGVSANRSQYHQFYCTQTESGKYCGELLSFNYDSNPNTTCNITRTVRTQSGYVSECQSHRNQSGTHEQRCCINARRVALFGSSASYPIASNCQLTVEPIAKVTKPQTCQQRPYSFDSFYEECTIRPDLRQKAISKLYDNSCTKSEVFRIYALCDKNENGAFCSMVFSTSFIIYNNIRRRCNFQNTICTTSCREALIEAKKQYGCCVNSYLYSSYNLNSEICQARKDIWTHCNVESPGFCSNDFQLRGSAIGLRYAQSLLLLSLLIAGIKL